MHVFLNGLEEMYTYIAEILRQMFFYDIVFGSVRMLGFPKGSDDSCAHMVET
jgi:hypothetical protein